MPLLSLKTPAAGIFGKARNEITAAIGCRGEVLPDVEEFEADFLSYLSRLENSARACASALLHEGKELSHS